MHLKTKCCQSCPRCADCPVRVAAAVRRRARTRSLVEEVLYGPPARELPPPVIAALTTLDGARFARGGQDAVTQIGLE
jgi:hypothetical protein